VIADLDRQADQHEHGQREHRQHEHRQHEHRQHEHGRQDHSHGPRGGGLDDHRGEHRPPRAGTGDRQRDERDGDDGHGGRFPGVPLRRRTQIRDRTCIGPGCRAPASGSEGDHTRGWASGGSTTEDNLGSACRHDHRMKDEGDWRLTQPVSGHFVWTSRLGRRYHVRPPLIIQPLPDPIPRLLSAYLPASRHDLDGDPDGDDGSIWRASAESEPKPPATPLLSADNHIPPF
jgi:hypothetical protein